ncbi:MAG TPA: DUF4350 domain-containing protein [Candidatus Thermoplasmatota archaeon]|nr:DUF4350 domain-containing protein [Candidatus Thermoplasmatota archaeon]
MLPFLKDPVTRGWATMAVLGLVVLALLVPAVWNADDRHLTAFRDGREDASLMLDGISRKAARVEAILSTPHQLADVEDPARALLLILGTERRYSEGEARAVIDFIEAGGNVILADEGGYGTDIAAAAGFGIVNTNLVDTRNHAGDPTLVVATATVEGRSYQVLFNKPTAVQPLRNANPYTVLAQSSPSLYPDGSFIDTNKNGKVDQTDGAAPGTSGFPLIVRTSIGAGTLVIVADTGLFMNEQTEQRSYQNGDFVADLVGLLVPSDGVILIDESRHAPPAPLALYANTVRTLGRITAGSVAPFVTLALVVLGTLGAWYATRETEDWSHHEHDLGHEVPAPDDVRPDLGRAQRMARRRISERFNIPLEQVAAMPAEQLATLTGDKLLSEAAAGTLKSDPAPLFRQFSEATR